MDVAIVTGAGRGIGREIALALAANGHAVVATARTGREVDATVAAIEAAGGRGVSVPGDVSDPHLAGAAVAVATGLGTLTVLVNNAGDGGVRGPIEAAAIDRWWRVIETNLHGPFLMTRAVLPVMLGQRRGRIININSLVGARPSPLSSAYAVSKAGLMRFTDCLAAELADGPVKVFDISPGLVRTAMTTGLGIFEDIPEEEWTPVAKAAAAVVALTTGAYDELTGRFVHTEDDLDDLLVRVRAADPDARHLSLQPAGADDPLFA